MKKKENLIKKELLFTGERAMPLAPNMDEQVMREHWARYRYAEPLIKGKTVLDVACGSGYGSNLLAQTAKTIVGGDIEKETIEYCKEKYQNCCSSECIETANLSKEEQKSLRKGVENKKIYYSHKRVKLNLDIDDNMDSH